MNRLEVTLTPAEFAVFPTRDLGETVCVVFDVLRATSTMLHALAAGADGIIPVADIPAALALRRQHPDLLLAGERDGLRIGATLTDGVEFDFGNSPREFTPDRVWGRRLVMTTTNGTRALQACRGASAVLAASFGNLAATARWLERRAAKHVLLVCAGTLEHSAYEDALGAGALADRVWHFSGQGWVDDSARMVRLLYRQQQDDLLSAVAEGRNGRRLRSLPELAADLPACIAVDAFDFVAVLGADGVVRRETWPSADRPR